MTKINKMKIALLGATALLAGTSAHAQVADTWTIGGADPTASATVTSSNTADVALNDFGGATDGTAGAQIAGGVKNSVSGAALGASASASFNVTSSTDSSLTGVIALDGLNVSATSVGNVTNIGVIDASAITGGTSNSISRAALGASASVGASTTVIDGDQTSSYAAPATVISASNDLNADGESTNVFLGTSITGAAVDGNSNSISAAALGSSAGLSVSSMLLGGSETGSFMVTQDSGTAGVTSVSLTSVNTANVALAGTDSTDAATLVAGSMDAAINGTDTTAASNGNSVSAAALGSSASVSYSATVYGGDALTNQAGFGAAISDAGETVFGEDGVKITAINGATFDGTDITPLETPSTVTNSTSITAATIGGSETSNNSISVAGIGASASFSFAVNDLSGGATAISNNLVGGTPTILAANYSNVLVNSTIAGAVIDGGVQNSVSTAALGASASQGFSLFTK